MKKRMTLIPALALACLLAVPASAHDGWSQTNTPIVSAGEVSYVELLFGNHSNHHGSYRIEGKWSTDSTKVYVTSPNGSKADITTTLFYTGEEKEVTEPGKNNYYVASFSASTPGAYIVSVEGDSLFQNAEVSSRTLRSAKSFVAVSDIPSLERVKELKGFSRPVSLDRAELVPQFNPAAVTPDQKVSVQLLLKGKPLANSEITLIRRSTSDAAIYKTDANGTIAFTTGPADYYLLRAKPATDEKVAGQYDTTNYEATMTFSVQNGKFSLPAQKAKGAQPLVYINGKLTDVSGLTSADGKTTVPATFVKTALNPAYQGTGQVDLRKAAMEAGATVEVLAPIGTLPEAIVITKK
ncbi:MULTISPECIES: DUF4198 domain-containing protein [Brevibacillus]|jgi:uncharacterized GH25 family protein|uniref:Cobalt ABC transporter periplasmic protein n=1 Tax=Brevibacillus borstelensis AK1 TaxID=1300222 RepID=M8DUZ4_9BACL|nr:DUF4198 domain-containing protein [Brevibacillus borstelensis]EMT50821.1 cobalt ABC transporter periplasmic protein [Brevibacillus borstelensis AK1]KKX55869.1 cobalt ABC transporter substrate-bindng protein [Brevibacillus borstelensis cifa_chp40]MBE5396663.1 DUF4198 domain-containing protein [Brevibacillus borstelensis]MCC0566680.1 DUF4198 domain-containing protein [Brevibacillus borstelensis]MCM3472624.1 DUF4198 domain-containing protein [Brevibacillus borstelensis]